MYMYILINICLSIFIYLSIYLSIYLFMYVYIYVYIYVYRYIDMTLVASARCTRGAGYLPNYVATFPPICRSLFVAESC